MLHGNEYKLVKACLDGDEKSLSNLLEQYLNPFEKLIMKWVSNAGGNIFDRNDIISEYKLSLLKDRKALLKRCLEEGTKIRTWFINGLRYCYYDWLAREKKGNIIEEIQEDFPLAAPDDVIFERFSEIFDKAMKTLSRRELEYLRLFFYEKLNEKEIAAKMRIDEVTVRRLKQDSRRKIEKYIEENFIF